ncbi:hypothetical protein ODZ84_14265 [Chryseobacterium fluminis]|uniref:hypothetical protein n=1 Tax=Chryseobacterium fluminis TaxID=2983606 RepID=UPI00225C3D99|nr:hypothetical protein [Chryseobacterium sp. MMS21-Ot14]UZT96387.1 hypothetical protein ODZ84_14265 [Chryseobacterium sp. MMS21-Ot14]
MKKYLLSFAFALVSLTAFAQNTYEKVMAEKIIHIEKAKTPEEFETLGQEFNRIGVKEGNQWLPFYYAAYAYIQKGRAQMTAGKKDELLAYAGAARKYLDNVGKLGGTNNAEVQLLRKMAYSLSMMENPQVRYATDGVKATEAMNEAKKLDPNNPRIALIEAEDMYFTPKQYGGSEAKGIELFKQALEKFKTYKPKSALDPNWGRAEAEYFAGQTAKK